MFWTRFASAVIAIGLALISIALGGAWLMVALGILMYLGLKEYFVMVEAEGYLPSRRLSTTLALSLLVVQQFFPRFVEGGFLLAGSLIFCYLLFRPTAARTADIATSLLGLFYAGVFPSYWLRLRGLEGGDKFMLLTFLCIWAADIGAYVVGKSFGKLSLYPRVSPKKTLEGAVFGIVASTGVGMIGGGLLAWDLGLGFLFGLLVGGTALLGDLIESLMKRSARLKDSGNIIPGHGGILDRCDSYIFTAPLAFYFILLAFGS
ncbi:phosphatidate cytidylyltransferase [Candidatus Cyanaurora vandensis]|uniref:phosphatidate cytidylyltransferase n=1 Tax=Candidatus Cyanaurora vandensis TaxID=2714958 RepID=UPI00257AC982|nr:phosphatidate cytidylyltransferase [Candidatus Cyanaurora vandensis]